MHEKSTPNKIDNITADEDPLKKYPRMLMMHRDDEMSLGFLIDKRIREVLNALLPREPLAVQTMMYFQASKSARTGPPPGSILPARPARYLHRGVNVLDEMDEENGCLRVVPGSQNWPLLC